MMKCHYTYYKDKGKIKKCLIPGCWSVVHSNDIRDCTCSDISFSKFEKQKYNEKLEELQARIKSLEEENKYLSDFIESIKKDNK